MRQLEYFSLLLVIRLRFTCGKIKVSSTNQKSQNIMNVIVGLVNDTDQLNLYEVSWYYDAYNY